MMGAGTVAQHLNRDVPALKFDMVDLYNLQPSKSGDFLTCSIVYDPDTEMMGKDAVVQPPDSSQFPGYSFLKSDITSALGLKSSTTNGNSTLFKNKHLGLSKKAKEWAATEGKEHSLDFDGMAIANWKARFLKTAKGGDDSDGHEAAKAQKKQKRQRANKSSSDEKEPVAIKKSKGKGKQRAVSDSEGMDNSD
ncbi:hypothetical protein C8J57DRAFT_1250434 [Mycena rebaudengoi]|nr:hypothetical protein C8J57DRAFT_1250434 [Mycena rebaudengoi]